MQEKDYSDQHKHCTVKPFDTAFGGDMGARLLNGPCLDDFIAHYTVVIVYYRVSTCRLSGAWLGVDVCGIKISCRAFNYSWDTCTGTCLFWFQVNTLSLLT